MNVRCSITFVWSCSVIQGVVPWMFYYNTKEFIRSGDFKYALAGNAPLIMDRADGKLYVTGTAHPSAYICGRNTTLACAAKNIMVPIIQTPSCK